MGEGAADRAARRTSARSPRRAGASRRSRSTCSCAPSTTTSGRRCGPGRIDFDDLLVETVDLLENDEEAADDRPRPQALVQRRRVPGHEPAPAAAAGAVARRARDLCVVGDEDQTIYTFTGATSDVPDRRSRSARPGAPDGRPRPELPVHAAGAGAREPAARRGRPDEAAVARRAATARSRRSRSSRTAEAEELTALAAEMRGAHRGRRRAGGDRGPRPDQRPARADRGGADRGPASRTRCAACGSTTGPRCEARSRACAGRGLDATGGAARCRSGRCGRTSSATRRTRRGRGRRGAASGGRAGHAARDRRRRRRARRDGRCREVLAELGAGRRTSGRRSADGVNLLTLPPGQGPRVGRRVPAGARGGQRCRSARRWTTTRRSRRSAGCCTSG